MVMVVFSRSNSSGDYEGGNGGDGVVVWRKAKGGMSAAGRVVV